MIQRLEKSLNYSISVGTNTVDRVRNQNKFVIPLFGAAFAAPKKAHQFYANFLVLISP